MHPHVRFLFILPLFFAIAVTAAAQQPAQVMIKVSAGTGFVINRDGDIVTNAHVVKNCKSIRVHIPAGDLLAKVKVSDTTRDLAVLQTGYPSPDVALLDNSDNELNNNSRLIVFGFPGRNGLSNEGTFRETLPIIKPTTFFETIADLFSDVFSYHDDTAYLQLQHIVEHGDSGAPVLNDSGNVIGVILGNALTYRQNPDTGDADYSQLLGESDVAIPLTTLQHFLQQNEVPFDTGTRDHITYTDEQLIEKATQFILPVRCLLDGVPKG